MSRRALVIWGKELRDILRDRRTLFSMILLPLLLIPLFVIVPITLISALRSAQVAKFSRVAYIGEDIPELMAMLKAQDRMTIYQGIRDSALAVEMIREKELESALIVPLGFSEALNRARGGDSISVPEIWILNDVSRDRSQIATGKVVRAVENFQSQIVAELVSRYQLPKRIAHLITLTQVNVKTPSEMGRFGMGLWLPYFLILMLVTGATYPALDLTAGEKERKTLQTLLVTSASRKDIVVGKFLTVVTTSVVAMGLSLLSMVITFTQGINLSPQLASELSRTFQFHFNLSDILYGALILLPLSFFFSALLLALGIFARSYREGQSYLTPVMLLVIFPAMASTFPGLEMNTTLSLVPIFNASLALRLAFTAELHLSTLIIVSLENIILATLALAWAYSMFHKESVLFRL